MRGGPAARRGGDSRRARFPARVALLGGAAQRRRRGGLAAPWLRTGLRWRTQKKYHARIKSLPHTYRFDTVLF